MKKLNLLIVALLAILFTSCDYEGGWYPSAPSGWNSYYDSRLEGSWELVQANGRPVRGDAVNYLDFYRNGRGMYYFYRNGIMNSERMAYYCQDTYNNAVRNQINIQYQYSSPSTMYYWFQDGGNTLWMQWGTSNGTMVYVYRYVSRVPY